MKRSKFPFKEVAVGGTFDVLHLGHERVLSRAFELGETVYVGISSDELVLELGKDHAVRPFAQRRRELQKFFAAKRWLRRAHMVKLDDRFGPTVGRRSLQALVVSEDTRASGSLINSIRRNRGLLPLHIFYVKMVRAKDGRPISSSRIRRGEVDVQGRPARPTDPTGHP